MKTAKPVNVLVTRPAHQANHFCRLLEQAGYMPIRFPTLEIRPLTPAAEQVALDHYELVIFISANAVHFGIQALGINAIHGFKGQIAAIGKKTAGLLNSHQIETDLTPAFGYNSEALLAHPDLQSAKARKVLIVKGKGGRQTLQQSLQQRGATVATLDVYQRVRPIIDTADIKKTGQSDIIDIISLTSTEIATNLFDMVGHESWLKQTPLLCGSKRIAANLRNNGIDNPLVIADSPDDDDMFSALQLWRKERD